MTFVLPTTLPKEPEAIEKQIRDMGGMIYFDKEVRKIWEKMAKPIIIYDILTIPNSDTGGSSGMITYFGATFTDFTPVYSGAC